MSNRPWPGGVSDGLSLSCADCGSKPRFDYRVTDGFWDRHGNGPVVLCLPCLDGRCGGVGLAEAIEEVQWTGTGHTVVLRPALRVLYTDDDVEVESVPLRLHQTAGQLREALPRMPRITQEDCVLPDDWLDRAFGRKIKTKTTRRSDRDD